MLMVRDSGGTVHSWIYLSIYSTWVYLRASNGPGTFVWARKAVVSWTEEVNIVVLRSSSSLLGSWLLYLYPAPGNLPP